MQGLAAYNRICVLGFFTLCSCDIELLSNASKVGTVSDVVSAIATLAAAILAFRAFKQASISARNSLKPFLITIQNDETRTKGLLEIGLLNAGVGPALITDMVWFYNKKKLYDSSDKTTLMTPFVTKMLKSVLDEHYNSNPNSRANFIYDFVVSGDELKYKSAIIAGAQTVLIGIDFKSDVYCDEKQKELFWSQVGVVLEKIGFILTYESIYRDTTTIRYGELP